MGRKKRAIGERWMKGGIRHRQGAKGVTYQVRIAGKWQTFKTYDEAKYAKSKTHTDQREGRLVVPSDITVEEWIDEYLTYHAPKVNDTTMDAYHDRAALIKSGLGDIRLQGLTPDHCERFITDLKVQRNGGKAEDASPQTKRNVYTLLNAALNRAVARKKRFDNPLKEGDVKPPRLPRRARRKALTEGRFDKLTHVLSPANIAEILTLLDRHRVWLPVRMLAYTGLRRGELCALTRADLDLDNHLIHVRHTCRDDGTLGPTKTEESDNVVTLDAELVELLREYLKTQERDVWELHRKRPSGSWHVFPKSLDEVTKPWRPNALAESVRYQLRNTRYAGLNLHSFRHAHGSALLSHGFSIVDVAARLRDSPTTLLAVYAHELRRPERDPAAVFAEVVNSGKGEVVKLAKSLKEKANEG